MSGETTLLKEEKPLICLEYNFRGGNITGEVQKQVPGRR